MSDGLTRRRRATCKQRFHTVLLNIYRPKHFVVVVVSIKGKPEEKSRDDYKRLAPKDLHLVMQMNRL